MTEHFQHYYPKMIASTYTRLRQFFLGIMTVIREKILLFNFPLQTNINHMNLDNEHVSQKNLIIFNIF